MKAYTYLLECADGTLYCGWTTDPVKRLAAHNAGTGSKYTRSRRPVRLVYLESFTSKHDAMSREAEIKSWPRIKKVEICFRGTETDEESGCPAGLPGMAKDP